jgi:hypothetical protein
VALLVQLSFNPLRAGITQDIHQLGRSTCISIIRLGEDIKVEVERGLRRLLNLFFFGF